MEFDFESFANTDEVAHFDHFLFQLRVLIQHFFERIKSQHAVFDEGHQGPEGQNSPRSICLIFAFLIAASFVVGDLHHKLD